MAHPRKLGKYDIVEVLGEGAMGVVYKGFDPGIRRTVAIKTIRAVHDDPEGAAMLAARFRNEAQAAGRLNHPGIVNVYDYGDDGQVAYIAMEFVEGQTLAHYLSHKVRFTDEDIVALMSQLLDALHHAHEAGVWHRDIKPANIMLAKNARLKVADFGIARVESSNLTQVHTMLGTPAYMAPEQFTGETIDRRVDVYAAGVMLYVLLTNRPPFAGTPEALMYKVVHQSPLAPSAINGVNRPPWFDDILAVAMAKSPDERYATALEFKTALENGVGAPVDTTIWEQTIIGVPATRPAKSGAAASPPTSPPTSPSQAGQTDINLASASWTRPPPTHWERSDLAAAESTLARFVGPLAGVMVRRASRECVDLPSLYAKLAQEVTDPGAKAAFAQHLNEIASQGQTRASTFGQSSFGSTSIGPASLAVSDLLVEQAKKLMTAEVGPIAGVLVRKTASKATSREAFIEALVEAVPELSERKRVREALSRLSG